MPCISSRSSHSICISKCPPTGICDCKQAAAFSCQPLCPCPTLLDNDLDLDASIEYCNAFTELHDVDPGDFGDFFRDAPANIGQNIDNLNSFFTPFFQSIPDRHCQVVLKLVSIPDLCISNHVTIINKIITNAVNQTCAPQQQLDFYVNNTLCIENI